VGGFIDFSKITKWRKLRSVGFGDFSKGLNWENEKVGDLEIVKWLGLNGENAIT
jgi:hypothetical protein